MFILRDVFISILVRCWELEELGYCKSRNISLQEKLANLAFGQNLNMVILGNYSIITQI